MLYPRVCWRARNSEIDSNTSVTARILGRETLSFRGCEAAGSIFQRRIEAAGSSQEFLKSNRSDGKKTRRSCEIFNACPAISLLGATLNKWASCPLVWCFSLSFAGEIIQASCARDARGLYFYIFSSREYKDGIYRFGELHFVISRWEWDLSGSF